MQLEAMVAFPPRDTIRFQLPAVGRRCGDGRSLLLEAVSPEGSGVLVQLRYRDSLLADSFSVVMPGDTAALSSAVTAVRYFIRDTPHGFVIDSGRVRVRRDGSKIEAHIEGAGRESGIRVPGRFDFHDVALGTDTVPCRFAP